MTSRFDPPALPPEDEVLVARYVAGVLPPEERARFEARLLEDPLLAEAVYVQRELARLAAAAVPAGAGAPPVLELPKRRRLPATRMWLLAASVVVLAGIGFTTLAPRGRDERFRSTSGAALIEPAGEIGAPPAVFRWRSVEGAAEYRFELTGENGNWQALVRDTVLDLRDHPDAPPAPMRGGWRSVPIAANGAELPAPPPAHFTVSSATR